jgi:hypothetical protein
MVMTILSFAHGCPGSLHPTQLVAFMKIPEKGRYIMVCNLSFELFASSTGRGVTETGTAGSVALFDS